MLIAKNHKGQAVAPPALPMDASAFLAGDSTFVTWLGSAGVMVNARGSTVMIDPVLQDFDMPLLYQPPILPQDIPFLDGLLVTHIDSDHFSRATMRAVAGVCRSFHGTFYCAEEILQEGLPGQGHGIGECFQIGSIRVTLTPALHNWQKEHPDFAYRVWKDEDACGYWLSTADGTIWYPGDSRLMPQHLAMPSPDVILFDFSDDSWHIGFADAMLLANRYPLADLVCIHWGSIDAPDFAPFNADPERLFGHVSHPERIRILAPGQPFQVTRK